jgi:phenylacetyl-CoA:acceptor oxidoreductase subunit 2
MTRETYFVALFYPAVVADLLWPHAALHLVVAASAAGFLMSQALILHAAKGIPAWRAPLIPWMLIATGLFEGTGLLALATVVLDGRVATASGLAVTGLVLALVNAGLWLGYRNTARARGIRLLARNALGTVTPALHGIGHALPAVLFGAALFAVWSGPAPLALAGIGAVAGGIIWKFAVITRACHQQGYAVPMMPRRGSGARAAPARYKAA